MEIILLFLWLIGCLLALFGGRKRKKRYNAYMHSLEWLGKRNSVLTRDRHRCTKCGSTKQLDVHHLTYDHFGHEPPEDLITVCRSCHQKIHGRKF